MEGGLVQYFDKEDSSVVGFVLFVHESQMRIWCVAI